MDRALIDDLAIKNGSKSRRQVAEENHYELPEEAGEEFPLPKAGGSMAADMIVRDRVAEGLGVGLNENL